MYAAGDRVAEKATNMDLKLAMLLLLIGSIIGLSHLDDERISKMKRSLVRRMRREIVPQEPES